MHAAILIDFVVISYLLFFGKNTLFEEDDDLVPEPGRNIEPASSIPTAYFICSRIQRCCRVRPADRMVRGMGT